MYNHWQKEKDSGLSQADAQKKYVELVKKLAKSVGYGDSNYKAKVAKA